MHKTCMDASIKLPIFSAVHLVCLPPVGVKHVDVSMLLQEIVALRREARVINKLHAGVNQIQQTIHCQQP